MDDLEAAVALFSACSVELIGRPDVGVDEIRVEWQSPALDLDTDVRVVFSGESELVGYVEVWDQKPHVRIYCWGRVQSQWRDFPAWFKPSPLRRLERRREQPRFGLARSTAVT